MQMERSGMQIRDLQDWMSHLEGSQCTIATNRYYDDNWILFSILCALTTTCILKADYLRPISPDTLPEKVCDNQLH